MLDTGQSKCYDDTKEIPCPGPGEPYHGQDAQYLGPEPAYQDNGDDTVSDLNTGLMWQQADDGTRRNGDSTAAYCDALTLAGYDDWRLPSQHELLSIVDFLVEAPCPPTIDVRFFTGKPTAYRSKTITGEWWYVDFGLGNASSPGGGYEQIFVRCVRGE